MVSARSERPSLRSVDGLGVALTTISKQCGTSVVMIEQHYAGVIAN